MVMVPNRSKKDPDQLRQLAEESGTKLITVLSKNGGHLVPNLGVVELTLAPAPCSSRRPGQICLGRQPSGLRSQNCSPAGATVSHDPRLDGLNASRCAAKSARLLRRGHAGPRSPPPSHGAARDKRLQRNVVCIFGDRPLT